MYALVEIKGKQYKAEKGSLIKVDKFENEDGYLVMTSSDQYTNAMFWEATTGECCFSATFWFDLGFYPNHDALDAFFNARMVWFWFNPEYSDNSNYDFF